MYTINYGKFGTIKYLMFDIPDKEVVCYRCFMKYNLKYAPQTIPEKSRTKEPCCPECNCKLYYS